MDAKNNIQRSEMLQSLNTVAKKKLSKPQLQQFQQFIASAVHFHPDTEYLRRPVEAIFNSLWELLVFGTAAAEPVNGCSASVRVFNPDAETGDWHNRYTCIYINQIDMPFLVDSLRIVLNRRGLNIYTLQSNPIWAVRDDSGILQSTSADYKEGAQREALISIEVDRHTESELLDLHRELMGVLDDVQVVVDSFDSMRGRVEELIAELQSNAPESEETQESLEFLRWIYNGYFTFTGCVEFALQEKRGQTVSGGGSR